MSAIDSERMEEEQRSKIFQELQNKIFRLECELAEYKQRAEAAEEKLRALEMQEPVQLEVSICGIKWPFKCDQPLYAKPFPSKQEEK